VTADGTRPDRGRRVTAEAVGTAFLLAAGFPTRWGPPEHLESCRVPKIFIQSTNDEHGPRTELESLYRDFAEPKQTYWVDSADHFFVNGLDALEETLYQLNV